MPSRSTRRSLLTTAALIMTFTLAPRLLRPPTAIVVVGGCDLRDGPCTAELQGGGRLTLSVTPRGIPTAAPLTFTITGDVSAEAVVLQGAEMEMGLTRLPVVSGTARGYLPVCTRRTMLWQVEVVLSGGGAVRFVARSGANLGRGEDAEGSEG
jgi:hypothetical protein